MIVTAGRKPEPDAAGRADEKIFRVGMILVLRGRLYLAYISEHARAFRPELRAGRKPRQSAWSISSKRKRLRPTSRRDANISSSRPGSRRREHPLPVITKELELLQGNAPDVLHEIKDYLVHLQIMLAHNSRSDRRWRTLEHSDVQPLIEHMQKLPLCAEPVPPLSCFFSCRSSPSSPHGLLADHAGRRPELSQPLGRADSSRHDEIDTSMGSYVRSVLIEAFVVGFVSFLGLHARHQLRARHRDAGRVAARALRRALLGAPSRASFPSIIRDLARVWKVLLLS